MPPAALIPDPSASTQSLVPRAEPVLVVSVSGVQVFFGAVLVVAAAAVFRWMLTDRRLEAARVRVGDVTVVTDAVLVEKARVLLDEASESPSDRHAFLDRRTEMLSRDAVAIVERLSQGSQPGQESDEDGVPAESRILNAALRALVAPDTVFSRITERWTLGDERAEVSLARTVEGADDLKELLLVPVLRIKRGSLVGALSLTVDGDASRTLPTVASRGVLVSMLRQVAATVSGPIEDQPKVKALLSFTEDVSRKIVSDMPSTERDRAKILRRYDGIVGSGEEGGVMEWMRSLVDLSLATDVIFAPLPDGCAQTRRIVVQFEEPYRNHVRGPEARARRFLGIGRDVVFLDLLRVAESNSYHLDVTADESSYVEQADVILPRSHGDSLSAPPAGDDSEYLLISPLRGDHRVHVYWRDFQARGERGLYAHVVPRLEMRLRERPPGLLGPTLALSVWIAVITWTVGYFYPVLFADPGATGSAWSTLILAAPALLTGVLLSRLTSVAVRVMSISTFALVLWLSVNVALVVSVSALALSGVQFDMVATDSLSLNQPAWASVMFLTGLHVLACSLLFVGRGRRYIRTINERWQQ